MPSGAGYPIEEFLEAITAQLDQTQDALRLKAVNRPLTFALKDFNVDLKVFVEMDREGRVTFRPAGPNESGASTVSIGFTTITRPMIEENTISMEMTQAPSLAELGLGQDDERRLARIGVRNGAQLRNLQRSAGEDTLSRHAGVNLERIRSALNLARPRLEDVSADPGPERLRPSMPPDFGPPDFEPAGIASPGFPPDDGATGRRPHRPADRLADPEPGKRPDIRPAPPADAPGLPARPPDPRPAGAPGTGNLADRLREGLRAGAPPLRAALPEAGRAPVPAAPPRRRRIEIAPGARSLRLDGRNLIEAGRAPGARLDGRPLDLIDARADAVAFALPPGRGGGRLVIEMPDGACEEFDLVEHVRPDRGGTA